MSEKEIAEKYIKPYLMKLGFPEELISGYGKVPIPTGPFGVRYADYVCYIMRGGERKPYMVVEVKKPGERLDSSQPEFYAFMLVTPFFAITDGEEWRWYLCGESLGKYIRLENPPVPAKPEIIPPPPPPPRALIALFEQKLDQDDVYCGENDLMEYRGDGCLRYCPADDCLLGDTIFHATCSDGIRTILQESNIKCMSSKDLIKLFEERLPFIGERSRRAAVRAISEKPEEVKKALCSLYDESKSIEARFDALREIKGFGPFIVSQLLSSVDKKKYIVIEENVLEALRSLNMIEVVPRDIRGRDYVYINEICNRLMQEGFKKHLELGLALVHNFLWHLE